MAWRGSLRVSMWLLLLAPTAAAAPLPFTSSLTLRLGNVSIQVPGGAGVATVNASGGGAHLATLQLPAGALGPPALTTFTDPAVSPIVGFVATVDNAAGTVAAGAGPLAGSLGLQGFGKVCLFAPCSVATANVSVPLSVVGVGGVSTASVLVNVTVFGAPWTSGTTPVAGTLTAMGFAHGPGSATSSTALAGGALRLVSPIHISTNIGAAVVVPFYATLDLVFTPEPGTLVLLGSGAALLVACGRARRR